jgi:hypothetical protein
MAEPTQTLIEELRVLVPRVFQAEVAFARANRLDDGITFDESVKPPATDAQLDALEERLGTRLPPSYRAFLSLWDGADFGFGGGAAVLGTEDHADARIEKTLQNKRALFAEFEPVNPFDRNPIPFVVGDSRNLILFEPPARDDGEMDVVEYYLTGEEGRHGDLVAFFRCQLARLEEMTRKTATKKRSKPKRR